MRADLLERELRSHSKKSQAKILQRFFKTGPGQYGEGDIFIGVTMPQLRGIAKKNLGTPLSELRKLVHSPIHEVRMVGLIILTLQFTKALNKDDSPQMKVLFDFYLKVRKGINNWDLVDVTCPSIVGAYLFQRDRSLLTRYAQSKNLWERRIAIVTTLYFIRRNDFSTTLTLAKMLMHDRHDLIHKALGWMLREVGKKDLKILEVFLEENVASLPRTTLRYAIEKLPPSERQLWLQR